MTNHNRMNTTAVLVIALAGTTVTLAQTSVAAARQPSATAPARTGTEFRSAHWMSDRKVVNTSNEEIAEVSDLIVDRGSGRIEYVVIKTGTVLGMGGKTVAIPFGAFRWDAGEERLRLASTTDQLKQFPEFSAKDWEGMMEAQSKSELRQRMAEGTAADPYSGAIDTAQKARIDGEIKKVERQRSGLAGEQVVITIATRDGTTRRVALGPSWFVNGAAVVPMRGDMVVADTLALPREKDQLVVATRIRIGDREVQLRESDGTSAWASKAVESGGKTYGTPYWHYMLVSHLRGAKIECGAASCGKVHDIILERRSGEIAFLSIDPNQNFLGIADTKRLVPWGVATVALDGSVRIDATKAMILASPETPSDAATLTADRAQSVWDAYDIGAVHFEAPPATDAVPVNDAWGVHGSIVSAIDRNSSRTVSGSVARATELKFDGGVPAAKELRIKSSDGEDVVLLGPAAFIDGLKLPLEKGDPVTADVFRTTINGKPYWIARSIEIKGVRTVLLEADSRPVWDKH